MAVKLNKKQLESIRDYKYATSDWTPLDKVFNPFWEFCVNSLSKRVAPNLITCCGIIFPIASCVYLCSFDMTLSATLPVSVFLLNAFGMFWY